MKNEVEGHINGKSFINEKKTRFSSFLVNGRLFGIEILHVKEITSELAFTPVFHAPKEIKGYLNIRGQIHLVVDLRILLGFESKNIDNDNCVVLFKDEVGEFFGVMVDKIGDVIEVDESLIEYHNDKENILTNELDLLKAKIVLGVCKLEGRLMEILNTKEILEIVEKETLLS